MIVDVHAHMTYDDYKEDIDEVIKRAEKEGVVIIISAGTNNKNNIATLELAKKYKVIKPALGLYPLEALELSDKEIDSTLDFIKKNKKNIIAISEVGIDYHSITNQNEKQKKLFQRIIKIGEETKLPLIIHSRKAELDVIELLEKSKLKKIVMHCFGGNLKLVKRIENNGWFLSIPTNIVFSSHFQAIVNQTSISNILTETDAPYLSPIKGARNEPSFIKHTTKKISEIKSLDTKEVENIIYMNFQRLFLEKI